MEHNVKGSTYEIYDAQKYDKTKKNILLFMLERNIGKNATYLTYKYILNTVKVLQKDFNIFLIARSSSTKAAWVDTVRNVEVMKDMIYINLDRDGKFMKAETGEKAYYDDNKAAYNYTMSYLQRMFTNIMKNEKWIFDNLVGTISSSIFLPYERNHEIIPYDERSEKLMEGARRTALNRMSGKQQFFSFRMISQRNLYPFYLLLRLMKEKDIWHYSFCHDTSSIWYPWTAELNPLTGKVKCFYFVDDQRGMRDFRKFPSAEIQEAFGNVQPTKEELNDIISNKRFGFIFGGTFPYDVGYRLNDWTRFFDGLDSNLGVLIRTQTDGTSAINGAEIKDPMETKKFRNKKIKDEASLEVIRSISRNPNVKQTVNQAVYHEEQKDYMFTIILKCFYGKYDSLNFRIFSSIANGIIPLIADDYDIDNLQVPERFKKRLMVSNNLHIEDRISWAKKYPEAYKKLFWELYDYYVKPYFYDEDFYYGLFKNSLFKELY